MISALRAATVSSLNASQAKSAGQPEEHLAKKRLVRSFSYWFAVGLSLTLPAISFSSAYLKMDLQGSVGVAAMVGAITLAIMGVASHYYDQMIEAREAEAEYLQALRSVEEENNDLKEKYANLFANLILQRGRLSLVAEQADVATVAGSKVREPATVVEFPKGAGA